MFGPILKRPARLLAVLAAGVFLLAAPGLALADTMLFGINDDSDLFEIYDMGSGQTTQLSGGAPNEVESLTYGGGNVYYGMQSYGNTTSQLYKFTYDANSGSVSSEAVGNPIAAKDIETLEYVDGKLYAIDNKGKNLLELSTTGQVLNSYDLGKAGIKDAEGMAFVDGVLYASDNKSSKNAKLFALDLSNGIDNVTVAYLGKLGFGQVEGLSYVDGVLYGTSDRSNNLFKIEFNDDGSLKGTEEIAKWGSDIEGFATVPGSPGGAVPEPATMLLMASGLGGAWLLRRRRRKNN